ncbi:hypothetical protein AVEN_54386-1 [Araneus ventricosus]|uniref:Uncharacterized protein n=1 Tax=Araneus ventricosus TaxID=182803 RepID=A0A4Y2G091_ARAVE|nr:hypothetical protein AVEN_54386-1 [Araneus ventricosus]
MNVISYATAIPPENHSAGELESESAELHSRFVDIWSRGVHASGVDFDANSPFAINLTCGQPIKKPETVSPPLTSEWPCWATVCLIAS